MFFNSLKTTGARHSLRFVCAAVTCCALVAATGCRGGDAEGATALEETLAAALDPVIPEVEVPSGTRISVSLNNYLDSGENKVGDTFTMTVTAPVVVDDEVAVPAGTLIYGRVGSVESARRPNKGGRLVLEANALEIDGERREFVGVVTAETGQEGDPSLREDLKEIAAGAGIGGLVGGLIGGGKGVLAGVLVGGGGMFLATKGEQIELPPDTDLIVELRQPVSVPR